MKQIFSRVTAVCLALLLLLPALPAAAEAACDAEKITLILLPRAGESIAAQAGAQGMGADDFVLSAAGRAAAEEADAALDAVSAYAASVCHCFAEQARWSAALLGLAIEADAADLPALRAAGDLAPAELAFDVCTPAHYAVLGDVVPDAEMNIIEQPPNAAGGTAAESTVGSGSVIAVIDTGFDLDNRGFALSADAAPALQGDALTARLALVGKPDAAVNAKIPFAYNYADPTGTVESLAAHGTRVAALAAARTDTEYNGQAPGAQLLCMKVFGETLSAGADECAILSAIDDALLLGADVINLSLGAPSGERGEGLGLERAAAGAAAAGVPLICAVGNNGESGEGSLFYGLTGESLYPTAYPSRGTVNTPASLTGTVAVGAAVGSRTDDLYFIDAAGGRIKYSDSCPQFFGRATEDAADPDAAFADLLGVLSLSYCAVPGVGRAEDYAGLDLQGKAALVERGEISFVEKAEHAAAAGAIALIVYDNDPDTNGALTMELTGAPIPAVMISIADGARLAAAGEGVLSFPESGSALRGMTATAASDFSSRGMREDFTLAPALLATGENFVGLDANNTLAILSGTSYAAAQVSGALAAVLRRAREEAPSGTAASDAAEMAALLLQNTAVPLTEGGVPVSVRTQGAGVLDTAAAMTSPLLVSGNDGGAVTLTGAGDSFDLVFTVRNLTDEPVSFTLTADAWGDAYLRPRVEDYSMNPNVGTWLTRLGFDTDALPYCTTGGLTALDASARLDGTLIGPEGRVLTVGGGATAEYRLTLTLSAAEYTARQAAFPSGFTVEGRITLAAVQNPLGPAQKLTVPYAVFCGDWADTPLLSGTPFDGEPQLYGGQVVTLPTVSGDEAVLGDSTPEIYQQTETLSPELFSFNPRYLAEPMYITLYPLREIAEWQVSVTDAAGDEVYTSSGGRLSKTYSVNGGTVAVMVPLWAGCAADNPNYICPDGEYTVALTLRGRAGGSHTVTVPVRIDTEPPTLTAASFDEVYDVFLLQLAVQDNEYIRRVEIADRNGYVNFAYQSPLTEDIILAAGRGAELPLLYDGNQLYLQYFYVTLTDYAFNEVVIRIDRDNLFAAWRGE